MHGALDRRDDVVTTILTDRRDVIRAAIRDGWTVEWSRSGHLHLRHPLYGLVSTSSTPSDRNAGRRLAADLRRATRRRDPIGATS